MTDNNWRLVVVQLLLEDVRQKLFCWEDSMSFAASVISKSKRTFVCEKKLLALDSS